MQKVINRISLLLAVLIFISCKQHMQAAGYMNFVNNKENGLKKISAIDGWEFCMLYRPYDYIMLMENKGKMEKGKCDKRMSELQGTAWFNISIKRADNSITPMRYGVSSIEEYNERLHYYLNEAVKDIRLVYDKDTLWPMSYLFENNYNLSPQETMVVGFSLPKGEHFPQKNMRLSFVDRIFKNGIINAEYSGRTLENIPTLTF
jgi:hypothetical protein